VISECTVLFPLQPPCNISFIIQLLIQIVHRNNFIRLKNFGEINKANNQEKRYSFLVLSDLKTYLYTVILTAIYRNLKISRNDY